MKVTLYRSIDLRPEPDVSLLLTATSQRFPPQLGEHLHTHTKRENLHVNVHVHCAKKIKVSANNVDLLSDPYLHSGRRVMGFIEHWPLAQYSFVSHV